MKSVIIDGIEYIPKEETKPVPPGIVNMQSIRNDADIHDWDEECNIFGCKIHSIKVGDNIWTLGEMVSNGYCFNKAIKSFEWNGVVWIAHYMIGGFDEVSELVKLPKEVKEYCNIYKGNHETIEQAKKNMNVRMNIGMIEITKRDDIVTGVRLLDKKEYL